MATLCMSGAVLVKAGANVSTDMTDGTVLVDSLIDQAEGVVNAISRNNWVTNYLTLTSEKKLLLEEVTSNLAAIYAVSYDMSNYTTRIEAEDIINVLRDAALRGLSILRDQKVVDFINEP